MSEMSDHQDSEHFAYDKSWDDIEKMLREAERKRNWIWTQAQKCKRSDRTYWLRQYKGLEGVINSLRWVLGDKDMPKATVLGGELNGER
jgi:hypothetical protein